MSKRPPTLEPSPRSAARGRHVALLSLRNAALKYRDPDMARQSREELRTEPQIVPFYETQAIPAPDEGVDERLGWQDRGNPQHGFHEEDCEEDRRIALASDELSRLFLWLIGGGSVYNRDRTAPVNAKLKSAFQKRQLENALSDPAMIGKRVIAMLLRMRPDLLDGLQAKQVAKKMGTTARAIAHHTLSFSENFPTASKTIRRTSRQATEEIRRSRHTAGI